MPAFDIQNAMALLEEGRAAAAIPMLRQLVETAPVYVTPYVLLARAYEAEEQWSDAVDVWQRAQFLMPNSPTVHEGLARARRGVAAPPRLPPVEPLRPEQAPEEVEAGPEPSPEPTALAETPAWPSEEPLLDVHLPPDAEGYFSGEAEFADTGAPVDEATAEPEPPDAALAGYWEAGLFAVEAPDDAPSEAPSEAPPVEPTEEPAEEPAAEPAEEPAEVPAAEAVEELSGGWTQEGAPAEAPSPWYEPVPPEDEEAFLDLTEVPGPPPDPLDTPEPAPPEEASEAAPEEASEAAPEQPPARPWPEAPVWQPFEPDEPGEPTVFFEPEGAEAPAETFEAEAARETFETEAAEAPDESLSPLPRKPPGFSDLDRLIDELESARIVPRPDLDAIPAPELEDDIEDMVSETLARIYASQRQYDEAARVYELLSAQQPDRAAEFMQKAAEMRARASDH